MYEYFRLSLITICTINISLIDFHCSLYPSVLKYEKYPVGHPVVVTRDFQSPEQYFGIMKCKILGPRKLLFPVLPVRCNGKLKFPLCRTCAEKEEHPCKCIDDQRAFTGTWCIQEILKALEKGYTMLKIYEVYHWPQTAQYGDETNGLFTDYINTFLKASSC